jgi:hypothetical protein
MSRRDLKIAAVIYLVCTAVYAAAAAGRLRQPSTDTHFVYMADSWLKRRLDLGRSPPHTNDWAEVEHLTLKDGRQVAGAFQRQVAGRFRTLRGQYLNISDSDIAARERKYYVSFPPMPAVLLLPFVYLFGFRTNDVVFNVVLAGLVPALAFLLLRRLPLLLPAEERTPRRLSRDLWLTGILAFGSVLFFASVIGQVWYTAHIVSLVLAGLFLLCALPLTRPLLAGIFLGALTLTRPQMVFFGLVLLLEAARRGRDDGRHPLWPPFKVDHVWPALRPLLIAAVPLVLFGLAGFAFNYARFRNIFEFGHSYLTTMQADNIQRYGLFNYQYLSRNLACAFTLLPKLLASPPYLQVSYHGLSLLFTTPVLGYLLWPEPGGDARRRDLRRLLWLAVLPIALLGFLYQNDGYIQFGFRFSLDYMLLLILLLAVGNPTAPLRWPFRALALFGVVVNLFGAVTFGRMWQFYFNGFFPVG